MLLRKKGYPQEGDLVLCTVTKIYHTSIFVNLDEYDHRVGMISISEIAPGRIRNLRDYVQEGRKVVCKVLKVDQRRGHIDLSYRRVNVNQRRLKTESIKQEQKAEKMIEEIAKTLKKDVKKFYLEIMYAINKDYDMLSEFFFDVSQDEAKVSDYIKNKTVEKELADLISKRIKPPIVEINGEIKLYSKDKNGLEIIKDILKDVNDASTNLVYEGGGKYKIKIKSSNFKDAEQILKKKTEGIEKSANKNKAVYEFKRLQNQKIKA